MIGVRTEVSAYAWAAAELPLRTRIVTGGGEIAALSGERGWVRRAVHAVADGASCIVVDAPYFGVDSEELDQLAATGARVVISRAGLRADDVAGVEPEASPVAVTVQVHTRRGCLMPALVDAVGWGRVLAGGDLEFRAGASVEGAALADLAHESCGVSVIASERMEARGGMRLRATTIGAERYDVVSDGCASATITHSTAVGGVVRPRRWEARERVALRRALDALESGAMVSDIAEWRHDVALACRILAAH